jgi:hypothetical protein
MTGPDASSAASEMYGRGVLPCFVYTLAMVTGPGMK